MKKLIAVALLMFATSSFASDNRTKFMNAYIDALCAEHAGSHSKAVDAVEPFAASDSQMRSAVDEVKVREYTEASIQASWALVTRNWSTQAVRVAVSRRDREQAIAKLRDCFGPAILAGPKEGQPDLMKGAAAMAWFLQYPVDPVMHGRGSTPGTADRH